MEYIDEQTFSQIDYTQHPLPKAEYEYCTFKSCDFSNSDLFEVKFLQTEFIDCNLSNANISQATFQDVTFKNCKMLGLLFERCNSFGFSIRIENSVLDHSSFYLLKLSNSGFINCQMQGVDFTEADMKSTLLTGCDLLNATFENTLLEKADFTNATNYAFDPELNNIKGAKFSLPDVVGLLSKYGIKIE